MPHKSQPALTQELKDATNKVHVGALYVHYKQPENTYRVTNLAIIEATDEVCVVYQAKYGDQITFVRPLKSWLESVEQNGKKVKRFTKVED